MIHTVDQHMNIELSLHDIYVWLSVGEEIAKKQDNFYYGYNGNT